LQHPTIATTPVVWQNCRRFYSNAYTDAEKQDAMNLFLGNYVPSASAPPLWELSDDYYLHSGEMSFLCPCVL
jgi:hypothetical protein